MSERGRWCHSGGVGGGAKQNSTSMLARLNAITVSSVAVQNSARSNVYSFGSVVKNLNLARALTS